MELHAKNYKFIRTLLKPFRFIRTNISALTSDAVVHAFASFIFLSYTAVFATFTDSFLCTTVAQYNGVIYKQILSSDPTIRWRSTTHAVYMTIGALPLIFVTIIPSIILLLYPTRIYRHVSQCLSPRKRLAITTFAEAIHSCFKDGLNGTRDYRPLAGMGPLILFLYWCFTRAVVACGYDQCTSTVLFMVITAFLVSYLRPCKSMLTNLSVTYHCLMFGLLAIVYHLWSNEDETFQTETLEYTLIVIPTLSHVLVFTWVIYKIAFMVKMEFCFNRRRVQTVILQGMHFFSRKSHGYQQLS